LQIGIDSFAAAYDGSSRAVPSSERLRNLVEQIEQADQVGLDVFGIGEHHRQEYLDAAPTVILGAAAARTRRIRLTRAVTVLSMTTRSFTLARLRWHREAFLNPRLPERCLAGDGPGRLIAVKVEA